MRKIFVGAQVSIDGVMQAPGAPKEDPTKGFRFGGWVVPYFSREGGEELDRLFGTQFDLQDGPNLVTQGSTELVHALLANDLVDAMSLFTVPVVLGGGKKLFTDGSAPHAFKLTGSRVSPNGLIVTHYERAGEIKIGNTATDAPSDREVARRKRMKLEG